MITFSPRIGGRNDTTVELATMEPSINNATAI
jgi:hypothetical protein